MKTVYNYILVSALAIATIGCTHEEFNPTIPSEANGNEVKFGMSLDVPDTKTIYGPESNNAFPIYWSQGDKVLVASPQCAVTNAEYEVTPVSGQSYAEALNKTGAAGVQWGSTNADFYSVYPSTNSSWSSLTASNVTAKLNIASQQNANLVLDGTTYNAADMSNVIMYAQTNNVENGKTVDLKYKPYSTMIEFEMKIAENTDEQGNPTGFGSIKVLSLTLTAPTDIALTGDFRLQFNGSDVPTITAAGNNGNSIKMDLATQPLLDKNNQTLKAKLAMIPISGIETLENWTIAVDVLNGTDTKVTTHTKTMNIESALVPGKIHKIKLPKFKSTSSWNPSLDNWIPTLYDYKNIYLTELSLPGAWYAGAKVTDGYQDTQSITDLWNAGVRAFAVETKCVTPVQFGLRPKSVPTNIVVSGTADNANLISSEPGTNTLNTGSGNENIYKVGDDNITLKTIFEDIITCLKAQEADETKEPEFAVLVLSYADGGTTGNRPVDYGAWLELLYDSYNSLSDENKGYIYSSTITANTTVNDVLNKLIVKVNVDAFIAMGGYVYQKGLTFTDEKTFSYKNNLPALLSYNPFLSQIGSDYYSDPLFSKLSWKNWTDAEEPYRSYTTSYNNTDFWWCFSSANRTGENTTDIPTYEQRQTTLRAMIGHTQEIAASGNHNVWFYFNAGGTQATAINSDTDAKSFAAEMNPWLLEVIRLKSNGGTDTNGYYTGTKGTYVESNPSSLGLVFFNQCTGANETYHGKDIIQEIIEMNNKFKLQRAPAATPTSYSATATVGGDAF